MKTFRSFYKRFSESQFRWTGLTALGELRSGQLNARNRVLAQTHIREQGLILKKLQRVSQYSRRICARDILGFLQQLSTLLNAKFSIQQAFILLISCQQHAQFTRLLQQMQSMLSTGNSLSEAVRAHPRWFNPFMGAMIALGEQSGNLATILQHISLYTEKQLRLQQQFRTLLSYPCIILLTTCGISLYLILTVIPQFEHLFQHSHQSLPLTTRWVMNIAAFLRQHGVVICGFGLGFAGLLVLLYRYNLTIKRLCHAGLLKVPTVGLICQHVDLARIFHALALANQAGLPLVDALQWVASVCRNICYNQALLQIRASLVQGDSIRSAVCQTQLFPEFVMQMLGLGEESGTLQALLTDLSDYYTFHVDQTLQRLTQVLEPMLMVLLGIFAGGLILAMYMPMMQLGTLL